MSHEYIEDLDKSYVSEYDIFLQAFDEKNPMKSASQRKEIDKNRRIAQKRDNSLMSSDDEVGII